MIAVGKHRTTILACFGDLVKKGNIVRRKSIYKPSKQMSYIFEQVDEELNLDDDDAIEARKIFNLHFKKYENEIKNGRTVIVEIPCFGWILPHYSIFLIRIRKLLFNFRKGKLEKDEVDKKVIEFYERAKDLDIKLKEFIKLKINPNEAKRHIGVCGNFQKNFRSGAGIVSERGIGTQ